MKINKTVVNIVVIVVIAAILICLGFSIVRLVKSFTPITPATIIAETEPLVQGTILQVEPISDQDYDKMVFDELFRLTATRLVRPDATFDDWWDLFVILRESRDVWKEEGKLYYEITDNEKFYWEKHEEWEKLQPPKPHKLPLITTKLNELNERVSQ
jgi:hypothetical protein